MVSKLKYSLYFSTDANLTLPLQGFFYVDKKSIVIIVMLLILYSLGSALYYLLNDRGNSTRVLKALTWRIALSMVLFIFLFIAFHFGWLQPHVY